MVSCCYRPSLPRVSGVGGGRGDDGGGGDGVPGRRASSLCRGGPV